MWKNLKIPIRKPFLKMFQIQEQLRALKKSTQDCGVEVERTRQLQETHSINFYKHHQISGKSSRILCNLSVFVGLFLLATLL